MIKVRSFTDILGRYSARGIVHTKRLIAIAVLLAVRSLCPPILPAGEIAASRPAIAMPSSEEIERALLREANQDREAYDLPQLRSSPELIRLARKQSADMARINVLMHVSATGKALGERLSEARIAFAMSGENVARSKTCFADLIHRAFMDSPCHRKNILGRDFDEVGIGVFQADGSVFYVTQEFIDSVPPRTEAEVHAGVAGAWNDLRAEKNKPPVTLVDEVDRKAEAIARDRAAGRRSTASRVLAGDTIVLLISGPDPDRIVASIRDKALEPFGRGGIGVWRMRGPHVPGGAYFVCVIGKKDRSPSPR